MINKAVDDTLLLVEKYAKDWHTLSNEEFEEIINAQKLELLIEFQRIQNEIINTNLNDNDND